MNLGHIGRAGLLVILILMLSYLSDIFNWDPLFMGEITYTQGYITNKQIVPFGRSASYKLFYTYTIEGQLFEDHYYSNKRISKVEVGDSLKLEVSINFPSKNKVVGYYQLK